jgi:UDPglucose 6-dehydrogenase
MIVTEWDSFKELDWTRIKRLMQRPLVLDGRNLLNSADMLALGFEYVGVGKPMAEAWENTSSARQLM